ncbi:cyclopropane-fatty-acyl-phospholipid synthase family protein [Rhizobium sp. BK251]|uniref:SAM-dependent methyltransferase n=1 Tax=Rhizobium sp. BK251 TaxID=2512125 RepID=UPI00104355E2|nr:cyclopropane-fatty-acyl-phospholipid synthase family protein [Rhizobium sp. BK251]TCL68406.1 cyclopropane-fatty-acyl-phospholipid synthase [Rhizobium sp. BK251]
MPINSESRAAIGQMGRGSSVATLLLRRLVSGLSFGQLTIVMPSGETLRHHGSRPGREATLVLHRWRAVRRFITRGDLGFAEAYVDADWSSPDLTALLEFAAQNIGKLDRRFSGFFPMRVLSRLRHVLKANTRTGSRKNITFHYDLGNAFYRRWLDESMAYSSAIYERDDQTLEEAQEVKLGRIIELLGLREDEEVLEIGCGWGALACRLGQSGAKVTGVTLSREQLAFAKQSVADKGLGRAVALELKDYRDLDGSYDRIVSIEMLEAVGESYWPTYFRTLRDRLKPGGRAVLQVITIDEARFEDYRRSADFIQSHIFPGGMLPTKTAIAEQATAADLKLVSVETFGESYGRTLAEWRQRFLASWPEIEQMGFPPRFRRLWEYYLCYCEAGFRAGMIDVGFYALSQETVRRS